MKMFDDQIKKEYRNIKAPDYMRQRVTDMENVPKRRFRITRISVVASSAVMAAATVCVLLAVYLRNISVETDFAVDESVAMFESERDVQDGNPQIVRVDILANARVAVSVSDGVLLCAGTDGEIYEAVNKASDSVTVKDESVLYWELPDGTAYDICEMIIKGFLNYKRIVLEYDGKDNKWILPE